MQYLEVFFVREVDQKTLTHWLNHLAKGTDTRSNSQITEVRDEKSPAVKLYLQSVKPNRSNKNVKSRLSG